MIHVHDDSMRRVALCSMALEDSLIALMNDFAPHFKEKYNLNDSQTQIATCNATFTAALKLWLRDTSMTTPDIEKLRLRMYQLTAMAENQHSQTQRGWPPDDWPSSTLDD